MNAFIYYLHNGNDIPFYVGQTNSTKNRIKSHKERFGLNTKLEIIDIVNYDNRMFWEKHYMQLFISWDFVLVNKGVFKTKLLKPMNQRQRRAYFVNYNKMQLEERKKKIDIIKSSKQYNNLLILIGKTSKSRKEEIQLIKMMFSKEIIEFYFNDNQ